MFAHIPFRDAWKFLWTKSSEAAAGLIITLSFHLSDDDVKKFRGWFESLAQLKQSKSRPVARRIVQMSANGVDNNIHTQCNVIIHALCDDGSLWELRDTQQRWVQVDPIQVG